MHNFPPGERGRAVGEWRLHVHFCCAIVVCGRETRTGFSPGSAGRCAKCCTLCGAGFLGREAFLDQSQRPSRFLRTNLARLVDGTHREGRPLAPKDVRPSVWPLAELALSLPPDTQNEVNKTQPGSIGRCRRRVIGTYISELIAMYVHY